MKTDLLTIPGVGKNIKCRLLELGYTCVEDLIGADPERMYAQDNIAHGGGVDRCVLYVYRCGVYFAETKQPDPEKLKWWNWKDETKP